MEATSKLSVRSISGSYNVGLIGDLKAGSTIETTDKDGYYIMDFCGKVWSIVDGSVTMENGRNTVTSGSHRLQGATIEVIKQF